MENKILSNVYENKYFYVVGYYCYSGNNKLVELIDKTFTTYGYALEYVNSKKHNFVDNKLLIFMVPFEKINIYSEIN